MTSVTGQAVPPPGYNTSPLNTQNIGPLNVPGQQGGLPQGYLNNLYRSSYATPSSYHVPSSVDIPNPYYSQQTSQNPQVGQMVKLLRGQ